MNSEILVPEKYNIYMQDLSKQYLELKLLGYVNSLSEARGMVRVFRETFTNLNMNNATVFFEHEKETVHEG